MFIYGIYKTKKPTCQTLENNISPHYSKESARGDKAHHLADFTLGCEK